jgi:hypothetical protein
MATTLTRTTTEMRWLAGTDLSGATLTMYATPTTGDAAVDVPVVIDPENTSGVVATVSDLAVGTYLVKLLAERDGKRAWFPNGDGEELTIQAEPA